MSIIPEISYDSSRVKNTFVRSEVITPEIYNELNKLVIDLTSNNNLLDENAVLIREQLNTSSKDLNSAIHQGVYSFTSEAINIPFSGSNGVIFVTNTEKTAQGTSVITQLALCYDNSIYIRTKNKGENFTNWCAVYSSGDGLAIGDIAYRPFLKKGYVKANGATVNRSDYPRLVQYATTNSLFTADNSTTPWLFGQGDGETTFVLPDYRNVFIEGGDTPSKLEAGLPNATGSVTNIADFADQSSDVVCNGIVTNLNYKNDIPGITNTSDSRNNIPVGFNLDLSASNHIFGNSTTVQPPAIVLIPQIKY